MAAAQETSGPLADTTPGGAQGETRDALPEAVAKLETQKLSRSVGEKILVQNIGVRVGASEILAVVGPSGAGKSSFLRLLNRLDEPTSGRVFLDGVDTRSLAPRDLRRRVGMVMQAAFLFPGTVGENIGFGPKQRGEVINPAAIASLLERVGLSGYGNRDVANLSGGEAQRVALARTLANAPEALLLDEPTSALEGASVRDIEALVLELVHERGMACVIVTHNPKQALRMASRTMLMERGRLVAIGPTAEVIRDQ
jgi:putative ABC transport system ATP-binding protein